MKMNVYINYKLIIFIIIIMNYKIAFVSIIVSIYLKNFHRKLFLPFRYFCTEKTFTSRQIYVVALTLVTMNNKIAPHVKEVSRNSHTKKRSKCNLHCFLLRCHNFTNCPPPIRTTSLYFQSHT